MPDYLAYADRMIDAYNAKDFDTLERILAPDLDFTHFNRDFAFDNAAGLLAVLRSFASDLVPDRRFLPAERIRAIDDTVIREGYWTGIAQVDLPGFGAKGDTIMLKFCSVLRFDTQGLLLEWKDYG